MIGLLPHQAFLVDEIAKWTGNGPLVITAPIGSGAAVALESQISQNSSRGWVLVAAPTQLMLEQWRERLRDWGLDSATLTPDFALELADSQRRSPPQGIILATYARLNHVRARQSVLQLPISLL